MPARRAKRTQVFVLANDIRSLYNVGSIFRTCDGFGVEKLILTGITATPESNPKLKKVSLGAENHVSWKYFKTPKQAVTALKKQHPKLEIIALENNVPGTVLITKYRPKFPVLVILGEEVEGVPPQLLKLANKAIEIPMHGIKESFNVSVACGIILYHLNQ
jgi:tRNA G18 (ribose-2'-O)-methylase SpoU